MMRDLWFRLRAPVSSTGGWSASSTTSCAFHLEESVRCAHGRAGHGGARRPRGSRTSSSVGVEVVKEEVRNARGRAARR